jgi:hypothetical protein
MLQFCGPFSLVFLTGRLFFFFFSPIFSFLQDTSSQVMLTLGQAFEVAYQLTLRQWTSTELLLSSSQRSLLVAQQPPCSLLSSTLPTTDESEDDLPVTLIPRPRQPRSLSSILEDSPISQHVDNEHTTGQNRRR